MLVLKARESDRFPGLMATAVILLKVGSYRVHIYHVSSWLKQNSKQYLIEMCEKQMIDPFCRLRSSAYIHITVASFEFAYLWKPRPKFWEGGFLKISGFTSRSKFSGKPGEYFSRPFLPGPCASLENSTIRPPKVAK